LKLKHAFIDVFASNTLNDSGMMQEETKKLNHKRLYHYKHDNLTSKLIVERIKQLGLIRSDYSIIRQKVMDIEVNLLNITKNYLHNCTITLDEEDVSRVVRLRKALNDGFRKQKDRCGHVYKSIIPIARRQLVDLQLGIVTILYEAILAVL